MDSQPTTRQSLLDRLQGSRDESAWGEFVLIYEPLLMRLMRSRGLQENDARDTTQQVLLRISGAIERYRPDGGDASFRRWLFRIARNVAMTFLSKQSRQPMLLDDWQAAEQLEPALATSDEMKCFQHEYDQQVLAWAMEQVRCEFREATWLAFVRTSIEGRSAVQVARELKMTPGSVYVARSRIVARLRVKVEEFEARS
ncbi:MAG: sigma-70 family RNA polymerase sigma factor [Pirellulales bacterium]